MVRPAGKTGQLWKERVKPDGSMDCAACGVNFTHPEPWKTRYCPNCTANKYGGKCKCGAMIGRASKACQRCAQAGEIQRARVRKPNAPRQRKDGYRSIRVDGVVYQEHRYVMEQILGRQLLPSENVHHINGHKGDNRPENLELWIKPQPTGIRASDALLWAKEIISLYEGKV